MNPNEQEQYNCPHCDEEFVVDETINTVVCKHCNYRLVINRDAEFVDGMWRNKTKISSPPMLMTIEERVKSYLGNGGLFNPEHMDHDKVRNLVIDLSEELEKLKEDKKKFYRIIDMSKHTLSNLNILLDTIK